MKGNILEKHGQHGCLIIAAVMSLSLCGVEVRDLAGSEYADAEVSTNIPFSVDCATMSRIEFSLSLDASPTNCVEVSVGTDADGDGHLSLDEIGQTFGYNCGKWFQREAAEGLVKVEDAEVLEPSHLEKTFILRKRKMNEAWNLVKVTRRGFGEIGETVVVEGRKPGVTLSVR